MALDQAGAMVGKEPGHPCQHYWAGVACDFFIWFFPITPLEKSIGRYHDWGVLWHTSNEWFFPTNAAAYPPRLG